MDIIEKLWKTAKTHKPKTPKITNKTSYKKKLKSSRPKRLKKLNKKKQRNGKISDVSNPCISQTNGKWKKIFTQNNVSFHSSSGPKLPYRSNHSSKTVLFYISGSLRNICATGYAAVLVSLDISKTFDTIDHLHMLYILEDYFHISGIASSWFHSYLSESKKFAKIDSSSSTSFFFFKGFLRLFFGSILFSF